ncbi:hypothetical protein [Qipengyuania sp.]|uniref:spike base protein, RCAP_Rcc01079 family n=1 Tax=Qipengyuania sp. TaxID=2004515 RepID=UPI0035C82A9B
MADNISTPAPADTVIAFDEVIIGGDAVKVARTKQGFGGDGEYTEVAEENPLPVQMTGVATAARQDANTAALVKLGGAKRFFPITPDGNTDLPTIPDAIYVTGAGDIVMKGSDGNNVTVKATANSILPFSPTRVLATGTTASGIVGLVS